MGSGSRSIAGSLLFGDQWIYFAFIINGYSPSATDPATLDRLFSAINESLTLVKDWLSKDS